MKKIRSGYGHPWAGAIILTIAVIMLAGCLGPFAAKRPTPLLQAVREGFEGEPDNCTKCHLAWAIKFNYYRGWDRYGYIFGDNNLAGYYDPWVHEGAVNSFEEYYATGWWDTGESDFWPANATRRPERLSVLSQDRGLPSIPGSPAEVDGPVIIVASDGSGDEKSIGKAVSKAAAGTTVFVRPGTYNEVVVLKNGVSLVGEDAKTTIINPLNAGHAVTAANNSLIAGFTLTGTGIVYETLDFHAAVYVSGCDSTCVIMGNIFRENGLFGVWIDGTPDMAANDALFAQYGPLQIERQDLAYTDAPNPVICGNTFYRIGQRGVFCVHGRGEVFNNIFSGNVKALGLEQHSRPFIHHNVFFHNNVPMAANTSEPLMLNNVFYKNQWGQRMLRGANPVLANNVVFESPFFRDFDENGQPIPYPGFSGRTLDPLFTDPLGGDFSFQSSSPLSGETAGFAAMGIMRDSNLPQPPIVQGTESWGREVLSLNPDVIAITDAVDAENARIQTISASYTVTYEDYVVVDADSLGDPDALAVADTPQVQVTYRVPSFRVIDDRRYKYYEETITRDGEITTDRGRIIYNGSYLIAEDGRFENLYATAPDPLFIGERPFREAPGGFYRDYDQYLKGAAGPLGTFYQGYLHIMGGIILEEYPVIDGNECIVVRYPHIGKDQYYDFTLDPAIGYRPRKIEQYHRERLAAVYDRYEYADKNGVAVPLHMRVTSYAVHGPDTGKVTAVWEMQADEAAVSINR